ncbi:ComEC/Rec2 family competence protein [Halostella pelagica]|uniref:ComEC/Rec2 family competence protein n=1 Tax=Halostella pelagica TaxID=2583824 RepID=UPI001080131F|nr:MBL fold metallo-hydrolase [Halostella pelagica]
MSGNVPNGGGSPGGMSELLLAGASGDLDDVAEVALDEEFTNACDLPTGDNDSISTTAGVATRSSDTFANMEQLSLALDDDDNEGDGCPDDDLEVTYLDVQQGTSILLEAPNGKNMLIDTGPAKNRVADELSRLGVDRLDYVVITHNHSDHLSGLSGLLDAHESGEITIGKLYVNGLMGRGRRRRSRTDTTTSAASSRRDVHPRGATFTR